MSFVYREGFPWIDNSTEFGLVQLELAPILEWRSKEQARVPVSIKHCQSRIKCTASQHIQGGLHWTVYALFASMFGIKQTACFTLFVLCLHGGHLSKHSYLWRNNSTVYGLVQLIPPPTLEWRPDKPARAPVLVKQWQG